MKNFVKSEYYEKGHCSNHNEVIDIFVRESYYNDKLEIEKYSHCPYCQEVA